MINVDAQATGLDRRNANGVNLFLDEAAEHQPELIAAYDRICEAQPSAYLDIDSWHRGGDGCYMPGWLATGDRQYDKILRLRAAIEASFPMSEQIFMEDRMTTWLPRVSANLRIPVLGVEVSLSRGTDGAWKTDARAVQDGERIVRAAIRCL
jgi:hypothetical protein